MFVFLHKWAEFCSRFQPRLRGFRAMRLVEITCWQARCCATQLAAMLLCMGLQRCQDADSSWELQHCY